MIGTTCGFRWRSGYSLRSVSPSCQSLVSKWERGMPSRTFPGQVDDGSEILAALAPKGAAMPNPAVSPSPRHLEQRQLEQQSKSGSRQPPNRLDPAYPLIKRTRSWRSEVGSPHPSRLRTNPHPHFAGRTPTEHRRLRNSKPPLTPVPRGDFIPWAPETRVDPSNGRSPTIGRPLHTCDLQLCYLCERSPMREPQQ